MLARNMLSMMRIHLAIGAALACWSLAVVPASERTRGTEVAQATGDKAPKKEPHRVFGDIPFSYSYSETVARARSNGRPILAYFTFDT